MYKLTNTSIINRLSDNADIPADPDNRDYAEYLLWLADGNIPISADLPIPLTYRQLRAPAYPPMADYLDSIVKSDAIAQKAYIDACLAVKAKYPKPKVI